jgi:hypothetical protein
MLLLSRRWGSLEGVASGSMGIRCVQRVGLIPLRSWREYPSIDRWVSRIVMSCWVSTSYSLPLMITRVSRFPWRNAYFNSGGRGISFTGGRSGFSVGSSSDETEASSSSVKTGFPLQSLVELAQLGKWPLLLLVDRVWVRLLPGCFQF